MRLNIFMALGSQVLLNSIKIILFFKMNDHLFESLANGLQFHLKNI